MDPRQRYFHGAVDVSTLYPNEVRTSVAAGRTLPMLEASPRYAVTVRTPAIDSDDPIYLGWLAPQLWWDDSALVIHEAADAGTMTLALAESAPGAGDGVTIAAAATSVAAAARLGTTARYAPLEEPRALVLTPAGVTAGAVLTFSLLVNPLVPEWD